MLDEISYVVRFDNGRYYSIYSLSGYQTDDLKIAKKYTFDWEVPKDIFLMAYVANTRYSYELVKIKTLYQIVD
ncbi:hypothetical protein JR311_20300 (plasmid) [Bacillus velezensis]|uniref:hypothetical protein n=1 Tax=Bacillus velezensis TaxID=492670 RepID=UPI00195D63AC|nr:hypothetical protein [Bacillus velezensis]QRV11367.1 hypothetical protein JR311_20300 [Bacillus velezensis]